MELSHIGIKLGRFKGRLVPLYLGVVLDLIIVLMIVYVHQLKYWRFLIWQFCDQSPN